MPIYPFECPSCGAAVEEIRPLRDRDRLCRCECGAKMRRTPPTKTKAGLPGHYTSLIMADGSRVRAAGAKRRDRER